MIKRHHAYTFLVTNGAKQGCVLAPSLLSIMFSAIITDAFHDSEEGILTRYRTNGKLFNQRLLRAVTKLKETIIIKEFLFAYDCVFNATSG